MAGALDCQEMRMLRWLCPEPGMSGELVAGSFISSRFGRTYPNDIDIYFHSIEHAQAWCRLNKATMGYMSGICGNAYKKGLGMHINLIVGIPFVEARDLLIGFDIRACAMAYDPVAKKIIAVEGAHEDCEQKRIVWQTTARSITVKRLIKYITEKGFMVDSYQRAMFVELLKIKSNIEQELAGGYK
jgi:hypothetical protein